MQALKPVYAEVSLSETYKGKPRREPVWVMRYCLPSGKDSRRVLGRAWIKKGRPAAGYLTEADALLRAQAFAAEHEPIPRTRGAPSALRLMHSCSTVSKRRDCAGPPSTAIG